MNAINTIYKLLTLALLGGILLLEWVLFKGRCLSVYEALWYTTLNILACLTASGKYNNVVKLIVLITISALCHLQLINLNIDIKYGPTTFDNIEIFWLLFALTYTHCLYQQWIAIFQTPHRHSWKYEKLCVLLIVVGLCTTLFLCCISNVLTHIYLYYLPILHYLAMIVAYIVNTFLPLKQVE